MTLEAWSPLGLVATFGGFGAWVWRLVCHEGLTILEDIATLGGLLLEFGGWLGGLTFELVYILSWILRGLSTCLDYAWELIVTRIDDVVVSNDDQMDGWAVACSSFISYSTSKLSLATPEDWTPQTPLDWIQEKASWYLHTELVLYTQLVLIKSTKIEIFHNSLCMMVFINEYILLSFPFISGASCLHGRSTVIMHWWLINVVYAT